MATKVASHQQVSLGSLRRVASWGSVTPAFGYARVFHLGPHLGFLKSLEVFYGPGKSSVTMCGQLVLNAFLRSALMTTLPRT